MKRYKHHRVEADALAHEKCSNSLVVRSNWIFRLSVRFVCLNVTKWKLVCSFNNSGVCGLARCHRSCSLSLLHHHPSGSSVDRTQEKYIVKRTLVKKYTVERKNENDNDRALKRMVIKCFSFLPQTLAVHTKPCESSKDEHTEIIHNWLSSPFSCAPSNSSSSLNVARWVRKELLTKIILRLRIERAQRERAFLISFSSCFTRLHSTHIALRFNTLHRISWQPENYPKEDHGPTPVVVALAFSTHHVTFSFRIYTALSYDVRCYRTEMIIQMLN